MALLDFVSEDTLHSGNAELLLPHIPPCLDCLKKKMQLIIIQFPLQENTSNCLQGIYLHLFVCFFPLESFPPQN